MKAFFRHEMGSSIRIANRLFSIQGPRPEAQLVFRDRLIGLSLLVVSLFSICGWGPLGPPPIGLFKSFDVTQDFTGAIVLFLWFGIGPESDRPPALNHAGAVCDQCPADRFELVWCQIHDRGAAVVVNVAIHVTKISV